MGEAIRASLAEERPAGLVSGYEFGGLVNGRIWKRREDITCDELREWMQ